MSGGEGVDQLFQASSPQVSRGRPPPTVLPFLPQQARQNSMQGHLSLVSLATTMATAKMSLLSTFLKQAQPFMHPHFVTSQCINFRILVEIFDYQNIFSKIQCDQRTIFYMTHGMASR